MRKFLLFVFACCYGVIMADAQISQGGKPVSFNPDNSAKLSSTVPTSVMAFVDVAALQQEDVLLDQVKENPWRFGQNMEVSLNPANSGITENLSDGGKLWRLRIYSQGATSINLTFDNYYLPQGAMLFIYNDDHSDVIGAFTDFNNQENRAFATTLVKGDAITVEYYEPAGVAFSGELNISRVTHGYRGVNEYLKDLGDAGSCNVNVVCPAGTGWEDQINSVCMLVTGGSGFCTGALINNTANDGTPYVLTANHCYSDPSTWVFWFNWQSATCTNPTSSPSYNSISGSTLKAKNAASDFCLVQMNSTPPASYGVYYSGWNRTTDASITGTAYGIHHPSADIKKISWTTLGLTTTSYSGTSNPGDGSHWRITSWSGLTTTEGGSSGSPLFDPDHRIVGQLHGGAAACGNTSSDYYGKLGVSWTGGGTNATRLSNWLDPSSSGVTVLDGYDPNAATACTPPTTQAATFTSSAISDNAMTVGWSRGNGTGGVIVLAKAVSAVNANPVNGTNYTANAAFGSGTQIGTGNYVVYKGTGNSVTVTGLAAGTTYHYAVYEFNTTDVCFLTPALTGSAATTGTVVATCDTLTNILASSTLTLYTLGTGQWGYWTGHNSYGFSEFAEYYSGVTTPYITGLEVYVAKAYSGGTGGNHKVTFQVYAGGSTTPGSVLATKDVAISDLTAYSLNNITFDTPVTYTGNDFYVGYMVYYNSPTDTFCVAQTTSGTTNSGFVKYNSDWSSFPDLSSNTLFSAIAVSPILCTAIVTGIEDNETTSPVNIYPNPVANELILETTGNNEPIDFEIYNIMGAVVYKGQLLQRTTVNTNDFTSGVYLVKLNHGKSFEIKKIIKN